MTTGAEVIELDYQTDIRRIHALDKDAVVLCGNIDPSGVIARCTPEEVEARTRELIELYSDSPRLILNAGCAIPATTPSENIQALMRTARSVTFG